MLIKLNYASFLRQSNFYTRDYCTFNEGDNFIVLKPNNLPKDLIGYKHNDIVFTTKEILEFSVDPLSKNFHDALMELNTTGTIKGYEIASLSNFQKLWVSHYDLKFLFNVI